MKSFKTHLENKILAFKQDEGGNFAVIFVVCLFMITLVVGAAFDYTRMTSDRSKFQAALDSATLNAAISLRKSNWVQAKKTGEDHSSSNVSIALASNM